MTMNDHTRRESRLSERHPEKVMLNMSKNVLIVPAAALNAARAVFRSALAESQAENDRAADAAGLSRWDCRRRPNDLDALGQAEGVLRGALRSAGWTVDDVERAVAALEGLL
jgi:hypothetical protein